MPPQLIKLGTPLFSCIGDAENLHVNLKTKARMVGEANWESGLAVFSSWVERHELCFLARLEGNVPDQYREMYA